MSRVLSVKMGEETFRLTDRLAKKLGLPRNAYINKAVGFFNRLYQRRLLKKELLEESRLVAKGSSTVLKEFEALNDDAW